MEKWYIGDLEVESPWGNAGGVVRTVKEVEIMARTGVGWIEAGSYTLEKRIGAAKEHPPEEEDKIVRYYNPLTGEHTNSLSMPNEGMDVVEEEIPEMAKIAHSAKIPKPLVVNIAPVSNEPIAESIELVSRAYEAGADLVLFNPACPNVFGPDGKRHESLSSDPRSLRLVLCGLRDVVDKYGKIGIRLAPVSTYDKLDITIKGGVESTGTVNTLWLPNTWPGHMPLDEEDQPILETRDNMGGLSGPAMADKAYELTRWASDILKGSKNISLVSSSGIANNENIGASASRQLKKVLALGAMGAGTTFYYEPQNGREEDTDRLLRELVE